MSEVEDEIYRRLSREDEWACEENGLRIALFGDDEWSNVREAEWMESYKNTPRYSGGL